MLKKESEILQIFAAEPWKKYTFTELKAASKKKSKSYLDMVLKRFIKSKVLKQEKVGKLPVYSLNIASAKARAFAGFALEYAGWGKGNIPYASIERFMEKIPTQGYVFIITGSYARNKQTEKSDIDIAILVDNAADTKHIRAQLSFAAEMNIPQIHLYVFKNEEFLEMLLNKEANYGKEISRNCLILAGGQIYIQLLGEAMSHGFTGKFAF